MSRDRQGDLILRILTFMLAASTMALVALSTYIALFKHPSPECSEQCQNQCIPLMGFMIAIIIILFLSRPYRPRVR